MKKNKKLVNKNYFNRIITWVKHKDNYPFIIFIIVGIIISSFEYSKEDSDISSSNFILLSVTLGKFLNRHQKLGI